MHPAGRRRIPKPGPVKRPATRRRRCPPRGRRRLEEGPLRRIRLRAPAALHPRLHRNAPASRRARSLLQAKSRNLRRPAPRRRPPRAATVRESLRRRRPRAAMWAPTPRPSRAPPARRLLRVDRTRGSNIRRPARHRRPDPTSRQQKATRSRRSSTRLVARPGKVDSPTRSPITAPRPGSGRTTTWYGEKWATCCGRCSAGPRPPMRSKVRLPCSSEPESSAPRASWFPRWDASIRMPRIGFSGSCGPLPSVSPDSRSRGDHVTVHRPHAPRAR